MTKSIDVLPTWYWPDGVPRYSSMPEVTIHDRVVRRWSRRRGDAPAIVHGGQILDFAMLDERTAAIATHLERLGASADRRIVLASADPALSALAVLGALRTGAHVLVVDPAAAAAPSGPADARVHPDPIEDPIGRFAAQIVLADPAVADARDWPVRPTPIADVVHTEVEANRSSARHDPRRQAVTLVDDGRLVHHSEVSLLRAAHAFAAFFSVSSGDGVLVDRPVGTWEQIVGLLAPLEVGGSSIMRDEEPLHAPGAATTWWWVDVPTATRIAADQGEALGSGARVLVSTDRPLPGRLRRQLRRVTSQSPLTVFGSAATGPIAASAPAWHLDDAIGIPVTDVDLVPVDPGSGSVAAGPWVLLAFAGIGVKSPALAVGVDGRELPVVEDAYDTGVVGRIDANGMLYVG